jgi:anaerobic selenocysteine-containing dehydrogenase
MDWLGRVLDALGIGFSEELLYRYLVFGKMSLGRLKRTPGGMKIGDIRWGEFLKRGIRTDDGKLQLAPPDLVAALPDALARVVAPSPEFPLLLISGARRLASYNSWTHNVPALMEKMKGNWATLNPADATRLGVEDGQRVRVTSETGSVEIGAVISNDIREGVVAIHQFWGHTYESGMQTARRHAGVNVNFLHDDRVRDRFSGMPVYNGTPCRVEPLETDRDALSGRPEEAA